MEFLTEGNTMATFKPAKVSLDVTSTAAATAASLELITDKAEFKFAGASVITVNSGGILPFLKNTAGSVLNNSSQNPTSFTTFTSVAITKTQTTVACKVSWNNNLTSTPSTMTGMWLYIATGTSLPLTRTVDIQYGRNGAFFHATQYTLTFTADGVRAGREFWLPPILDTSTQNTITSTYSASLRMSAGDLVLWLNGMEFNVEETLLLV
jgi:hypothetical protein